MKTKFINEPPTKDGRRALRTVGYAIMEKWTDVFYKHGFKILKDKQVSYVAPETYDDQKEGYLRLVLNTGEELRFYHSPGGSIAYKILFVYTDYTVGVSFDVTGENWSRMLFRKLYEDGILEHERSKTLKY